MVMPADSSLQEVHDISLQLQHKVLQKVPARARNCRPLLFGRSKQPQVLLKQASTVHKFLWCIQVVVEGEDFLVIE